MKKIVAVTVLFLLLGASGMNPLMAQEGSKIGFRASPLVSWGNITDRVTKAKPTGLETKAAMGFNFDFIYTYGFSENVGIKTGITLSTRGIKSSVALSNLIGGESSLDSKLGITSVIVPVGFKFRSPEIGKGMFIYGVFGADAELNVQNKIVGEYILGDASGTVVSMETRDNEGISIFTTSFAPGAGLDWQFDWGMLEFGLTYNWGLMSYTTKKFIDQDQVTKMNSIGLNLGYFF